jgi:hypothetical protein
LLHHFKGFIAHTHNNNGAGQAGSLAEQMFDLRHIVNFAISEDQQYLVSHCVTLLSGVRIELSENLTEVGRAR